ncbi:MAG: [Fe-Fe] hydrogenase large subunit C-terminal domain-containing protein [Bacteroidota bacterium]
MSRKENIVPMVYTIRERCRICYTCVRECPAKAIKIATGQAEVIHSRCIGCGNCVKVCSQDAKQYYKRADKVLELLRAKKDVYACIAPSFPAEFREFDDYKILVGMIRALGFRKVQEVSFGADLVAIKYKELLAQNQLASYISSDCPGIVNFIEKYHPDLTKNLVPVVSPMQATARVMRQLYGDDIYIVFIGPCIAKKNEGGSVDEVITFRELREMFALQGVASFDVEPSEFDGPLGGHGSIFPVTRGLLHNLQPEGDILNNNYVVADGRHNFVDAIKELDSGLFSTDLLELLCCHGCIKGVGMTPGGKVYSQMDQVKKYASDKISKMDMKEWQKNIDRFISLDLEESFEANDQRILIATPEEINKILKFLGKESISDHLNCGACGYDTCEEHAIAIFKGIAEQEMCLPYTIEKLHKYNQELALSNEKLANIKLALKQSEKLAHMGQLSAGIAHELNNPLGVVIMYSNILLEDCPKDSQMREDLELIVHQADRCKNIVGGLLNFARTNQVRYASVAIAALADECVESVIVPANVELCVINNLATTNAMLDREQMVQAITNLIKNAIEAMPQGGKIEVILEETLDNIKISIHDNGTGIPKEHMEKLFTPFFTTKGVGKGTGLGLPTVYGIIKMHKGDVHVDSNTDPAEGPTGTTFIITLPKRRNEI